MGRTHLSMKRGLLLSTLAIFATTAIAQTTTAAAAAAATTTAETAETTNTAADDATTDTDAATTVPAITSAATTTTAATATSVPSVTSGTTTYASVPKLSDSNTYSYAAPTVPPTNNAPYMQKSTMPEGTVFIAVGAILGACGAAILIWRAVVACLLHRSVKRATLAQHMANDKMTVHGANHTPFYKYSDRESTLSLGAATATSGRGVRRTQRGPIPSATPSQTNLFFSPTAGNPGTPGNRSSTFLPSGFYAAGQGAPQQGHEHSISMSNLRPDSRGIGRAIGHSPPESPAVTPRRDPTRRNPQMSTSSLNLNQLPTGRAPSTYLEDLLDDQPGQFPPQGGFHNSSQSRDRF
ncbi:hypothetical protein BJ170DRAFT_126024 [Xylariales sp. AK1849]|nr:hypothetical protein BJ170DRAFT_126024 [Xylariales sp. AK1849]